MARNAVHRGERGISRKPLRRECRCVRLNLWSPPRAFLSHGGHGRSQRPAFPAPSSCFEGRRCKPRAKSAPRECEAASSCRLFENRIGMLADSGATNSAVVPAKAGTHNHKCVSLKHAGAPACFNNAILWLWVPDQRSLRSLVRDDSEHVCASVPYAPFSSIALKSARARCASARATSLASTSPK